jgi:CDGSH-type Zn-finger protein
MTEPKIPKKGPYVIHTEAGTYAWCGCGMSKNQPFCDNTHKGTEYEGTKNGAMLVQIEEDGHKPWCGCKHTGTPPWCDGSHSKLK